ncbi:S41 family peptidase [Pedobacter sp. MC2016-05]|uniref:S41 family peptidase n=1 Tax=Pedobacter sp. MC2016-05 TaxID=2994474 RepID=UPI0022471BAC|nr:S41 family peptidase [Pedobacter sp. MC2016-05]MCX2473430.1 S41 family peptidase [Pedobacter sp. MC2016-05]
MKKNLLLVFVLSASLNLKAQKKTSQDSIAILYKEIFSALKKKYLHKGTVNWSAVEAETNKKLTSYSDFNQSLNELPLLFKQIGATHCNVYYQKQKYAAKGKIVSKDAYSEQWKKKYDSKPAFEVKVIGEKYGYILMPAMVFFDLSAENIHKIAQPMYDQIAAIKNNNKIEGWIVDLRFNTGGNSMPMLLALYDFLGDNKIWGVMDVNKKPQSVDELRSGNYLFENKKMSYIKPSGALLDQSKVAVLTGVFTASSGEVTAIAFKGRPNTKFIGEATYGATTANIYWPLPFDATMALTTSYYSDRNGVYHENIVPDVLISKQDHFDDLLTDGNIKEAIKFFENEG